MMKFKNAAILMAILLFNQGLNINAMLPIYKLVTTIKPTSFTGNWILDEKKSDFGKMPLKFAYGKIQVLQTKDSITIKRINQMEMVQTLALNGKMDTIRLSSSKRLKVAHITWLEQAKTLQETASFIYDQKPLGSYQLGFQETWVLDAKTKTLSITRETYINDSSLNYTTTAVYQREEKNEK